MITFIVGPTATGKSDAAFKLARETKANILSADSRQVYQGLEITSGVDLPLDFISAQTEISGFTFFTNSITDVFGVCMLQSNEDWSIAQFREYAEACFVRSREQRKDLIVVGGSGLFLQSLFLDKQTIQLPRQTELRDQLAQTSLEELQQKLLQISPHIQTQLNNSDWNNPRRLIRWIEKLEQQPQQTSNENSIFGQPEDHKWIGLTAEKEVLHKRIELRVKKRIEQGAVSEVERLINSDPAPTSQILSTTGVKEVSAFLNNQISEQELIDLWTQREFSFAKRQLTWFKKRPYIRWQQIS